MEVQTNYIPISIVVKTIIMTPPTNIIASKGDTFQKAYN